MVERPRYQHLRDPLPDSDKRYKLCRLTGRPYVEVIGLIAEAGGNVKRCCQVLRIKRQNFYCDDHHWARLAGWIRLYIPQWESTFRTMTEKLSESLIPSEQQRILDVAAKALNISPELLTHYALHREDIELFLAAQRHTLGTLAEAKLWELVAAGDAATIRWLLPRIKTDIFGDKQPEAPNAGRTIRIIDVGD